MTQTLRESYDEVPYEGQSFAPTHPDRLATLARLRGLASPDVTRARVLEVGCGLAGNLGPMAVTLPGASFVGVDLSQRHVDVGRARLAEAGVTNAELSCMDLTDAGDSLGAFDYVVAHGLYSWVPPEVGEALLALMARSLSPNGVAYLSFNVLPGWHGRSVARDLMLFHAEGATGMTARIARARAAIKWMLDAMPTGGRYAQPLVLELTTLAKEDDWYLAHEMLCAHNHPVAFCELVLRAARHGLQYLGDASPQIEADHTTSPLAAKARALGGEDPIRTEQYLDILMGRTFRRAIFCRAGASLARAPRAEAVDGLRVASRVAPVTPPGGKLDLVRRAPVLFRGEAGELNTDHAVAKVVLAHLARVAPRSLPFAELIAHARGELGDVSDRDKDLLRRLLLRSFLQSGGDTVELHTYAADMVAEAGERPRATAWARLEAPRRERVTSMRHEGVPLDATVRLLVPLLDGTRTVPELLAEWKRLVGRDFLPGAIDAALAMLAKRGLLVA